MIDFVNGSIVKLSQIDVEKVDRKIYEILIEGERLLFASKGVRDSVVLTSKRIIVSNVQGMTGKKVSFTSLPYSKIVTFSVETGGTLDLDTELSIWISGVGSMKFEFVRGTDISYISRLLASVVL